MNWNQLQYVLTIAQEKNITKAAQKLYLSQPSLSMSMKSLEEMLPASRFIRVHRSFIVQPEKIKVIERNRIVFGKEYIPISDNYKPRLVEFLAQRSLNFN